MTETVAMAQQGTRAAGRALAVVHVHFQDNNEVAQVCMCLGMNPCRVKQLFESWLIESK
jgi:hypothetical protein